MTTVYSKEANAVYVNVVNRHNDKTIIADITLNAGEFMEKAEAKIVGGNALKEVFTYDQQGQYVPVAKELTAEKNKLTCSFPAHSFTQIKIGIKK